MPLTHFICPDKKTITLSGCLEACRLQQHCLTRTTLKVIVSGERVWDGVPHVTGLLNGTMLEFLKLHRDYAIDPRSRAFALLGSSHHKLLEQQSDKEPKELLASEGYVSELPLNIGWIQGTLDLLEQENSEIILSDFKSWGSNRLVRDNEVQVFDPVQHPPEMLEAEMQMNMYKIMARRQYGWNITKLQVQCTVRDGGLSVAYKRGVKENMYLIPVRMLDTAVVEVYFKKKAEALTQAVANQERLPEPCTSTENWGGNRCRSYCEVRAYCPLGVKYM